MVHHAGDTGDWTYEMAKADLDDKDKIKQELQARNKKILELFNKKLGRADIASILNLSVSIVTRVVQLGK